MNWEIYSHALGNLWKLVSHISESSGLPNSINFYSKLILWEESSFSYDIPMGIWDGDCLGFLIISNFLKHPQPGNDMAFRIFPCYENSYIPKQLRICEEGKNLGIVCFPILALLTSESLCFSLLSPCYRNLLFLRLGSYMAFCFMRQM